MFSCMFTAFPGARAPAVTEVMESDDDDDDMVMIGGERVPYHEVTDEMVQRMTPQEKEVYIQTGQEMYQDMYD